MALQPPNIATLSRKVDPEVKRAFDALKDWLNKARIDGGLVTQGAIGTAIAAVDTLAPFFDGTIPPQLQGFVVNGGFATILMQWDDPRYKHLSYVEVWRNTVDDLGTAQRVGTTVSVMYADTPPNASLAVTYYYWVRVVSAANIIGPFNATAGTPGNTANDPAYVLEVLSNEITESQLHIDLNSRIDLVDADNVGIVAVLDKLGTALAGLTAADSDRWERLLFERQVTDATVEVAPVAYCTLSAYTDEASCIAHDGVWKPGGTIRLKATADITSDIDASLRTLQSLYDAMDGTITTLNGVTEAHTSTIASYLTDANSSIVQLSNGLTEKASVSYVDLTTDAIANAADVATYASQNDIPMALAYAVLHADDAAKKLRGANANIATHAQEIQSNATAIEAESHFRTELDAKVDGNQAGLVSNYYTKSDITTTSAGWISTAVASAASGTTAAIQVEAEVTATKMGTALAEYTTKLEVGDKLASYGMTNDGTTSRMLVEVDEFAVMKPGAVAGTLPAIAVLTTPQTINGITIPAGTYIDGANIAHLTANDGVIQGLAVDHLVVTDDATIWEDIINVGKITNAYIGDTIQSNEYTPGSVGWYINKNGSFEFSGGTFRGVVSFASGSSGYANLSDKPDLSVYNTAAAWVKPGQTTIDGNKIYTGDAYVDTLQIKGDSIWVPQLAVLSGSVNSDIFGAAAGNTAWTSTKELFSLASINYEGGKVIFHFRVSITTTGAIKTLGGALANTTFSSVVQLRRSDGLLLKQASPVYNDETLKYEYILDGFLAEDSAMLDVPSYYSVNIVLSGTTTINGYWYGYATIGKTGDIVLMAGKR